MAQQYMSRDRPVTDRLVDNAGGRVSGWEGDGTMVFSSLVCYRVENRQSTHNASYILLKTSMFGHCKNCSEAQS